MEDISCICKNPQAQSIEIFFQMLSGRMNLSVKARKYIFYMYLLLFGSCTREMVPLLLGSADQSVLRLSSNGKCNYIDAKAIDNFISNRLKCKEILKITIKNRILYKLTPNGYKNLSKFLSSQKMTEGIDASYLKWCVTDACNLVCKNSVHSSVAGIIFIHIAFKCSLAVSDFRLNTPLDQHGNIRTGLFDQSLNRFRSDAYLLIYRPCMQEFFFENDMGTERVDAITAKLERYFALIFSAERDLCSSCIHFTIGDYHVNKEHTDLHIPSKYTLQIYKACVNVLLATAGVRENIPVKPDKIIELINEVSANSGTVQCNILTEIKKYVSEISSICPELADVYSCFDKTRILKAVSYYKKHDCGVYHLNSYSSYLKRREKIFEYCRTVPDMSMLVKRGLRITSSDNCSNATDFMLSYPNLNHEIVNEYMKFIDNHIQEFSYRGKYTDIRDDNNPINKTKFQGSLGEYENIIFFQTDNTFYPFANCYSLHHYKGSFKYSFENISNDISARMRIERYLNDGAPVIPFLQIFIVYSDDIYSLKYVDYLKENYSIFTHEKTYIRLERLSYTSSVTTGNKNGGNYE